MRVTGVEAVPPLAFRAVTVTVYSRPLMRFRTAPEVAVSG
jgi:hypothetical protein